MITYEKIITRFIRSCGFGLRERTLFCGRGSRKESVQYWSLSEQHLLLHVADIVVMMKQRLTEARAMMTSGKQETSHIQRTESVTRGQVSSVATVTEVKDLSSTVKLLTLRIHNKLLTFKAGQWVDFTIPGVDTVGGFSMCSSPQTLVDSNTLDLSVKYTDHPPAHWVHTKCRVGSDVSVRVGGDFYLDSDPSARTLSVVLIAGGVGINPLLSMLRYAVKRHASTARVLLIYSARTVEELLFLDVLREVCDEHDRTVHVQLFVSRETLPLAGVGDLNITGGRITHRHVTSALRHLNADAIDIHGYLCGPSPMIDTMETYLREAGLAKDNIHYEKWW